MNHLSLFSGIGGFDLAAQWMGWNNIAHVEKNEYCRKILKQHFPKSESYEDIKEFDGTKYRGAIDIISGGFPCQPFSVAGKQKSKSDDRYLWPEMLRVIEEIKPRWIVGENVYGIIKLALDEVLSSLEDRGYTCETFIIPACATGAWHKRDRVWIVANTINNRHRNKEQRVIKKEDRVQKKAGSKYSTTGQPVRTGAFRQADIQPITNTNDQGLQGRPETGNIKKERKNGKQQPPGQGKFNGREYWETEPGMGRVANGIPSRVDRIKALGNAVVPQVVYEIFKIIQKADNEI